MREAPLVHLIAVCPRRRLDDARTLVASAGEAHPGWRVEVVAADSAPATDLEERELLRRAAIYDEEELCAALKPSVLRRALQDGADVAVFLDWRLAIDSSLDALTDAAQERGVALVPLEEVRTDPRRALDEGAFDTRILAVGPGGRAFLDWLDDRVARHCLLRPDEGLWLDQRWLAASLAVFDAAVVANLPVRAPGGSESPPEATLDAGLRAQYREALLRAENAGLAEPPNPLSDGADAFAAWCDPPKAPGPPPIDGLAHGVNLVVRLDRDRPIDELAGDIDRSLAELGLAVATLGFRPGEGDVSLEGVHPRLAPYDTTLVCLDPLDLVGFAFHVDAEFFARRRSVGVWLAEETPAPDLQAALGFLDEVWLPSTSAAAGLATRTSVAVSVLPPPVAVDTSTPDRVALGLREGRLVLSICDLADVFSPGAVERENPLGLVEAFERAFRPGEGPTLVVRLVDGGRNREARERVRLASTREDVLVLDGPLGGRDRRALVAACDCFASLHRAADYELAVAEALAAGTLVVATATECARRLAGEGGALLVPATPAPAPPEFASYWTGASWSEPDLDEAARLLRVAWERPDEADAIRRRGRESVDASGSGGRLTAFLADQLPAEPTRQGRLARLLRRG